jgi:hypothetical protein
MVLVLIEFELSATATLLKARKQQVMRITYISHVNDFACVPRTSILIESCSTSKRLKAQKAKAYLIHSSQTQPQAEKR